MYLFLLLELSKISSNFNKTHAINFYDCNYAKFNYSNNILLHIMVCNNIVLQIFITGSDIENYCWV
jgi:hypothetical protein